MGGINRVAITNVFGPLNRGDFELFHQLVDLVTNDTKIQVDAIAREPDGCEVYFPNVKFHPQPGVAAEYTGKFGRAVALFRTLVLFSTWWLRGAEILLPKTQRRSLNSIRESDLVIACPGGYLTSSSWSFYPTLAQLAYAARYGREVWLAPMSIGPTSTRLQRLLLQRVLKSVDQIYVRESWSEQYCQKLGVPTVRSADLAFRPARRWLHAVDSQPSKEFITATVVRWNFPGVAEPHIAQQRYHCAMIEALNEFGKRLDLPVRLLLQVDNDRKVTEIVAKGLAVEHEIIRVDTPDEYRAILQRSALMIGSRFHSAIFAMTVGCPTIVVSYLPKAKYMMMDMGLGALVHDIENVSSDGLVQSFHKLKVDSNSLEGEARQSIVALTEDDANPFVMQLRMKLE